MVRGAGVDVASEVHQCLPPGRGKHPPRSSPCPTFIPQIATSSRDASSYGISIHLHRSLFSHCLAQLYSDSTVFLRTLSSRYGSTSTMRILSSAPESSFRITFANSHWTESHGPIQSQLVQRSFSLTSFAFSIASTTIFFPPSTMVVSRTIASSWLSLGLHRHLRLLRLRPPSTKRVMTL